MGTASQNNSATTSRISVRVAVGILLLALIALAWFSFGGLRSWQVSSKHIDSDGQLSAQVITQLRKTFVTQDAVGLAQISKESPRLMSFISSELSDSEEHDDAYASQLIELAFLAKLNEQVDESGNQASLISVDTESVNQLLDEVRNHQHKLGETSDYTPNLEQQNLIANSARFLAAHFESEQLHGFRQTLFDTYLSDKQRRSPYKNLQTGLLEAIWISSREDNPHWVTQYFEISTAADDELGLRKESDLMRLLNSDQDEVVINAARVIGSINPQHAATSLRYHLAKTKNQRVKFALLDAIGHFGEEVDVLEPQLKRMQQVTNDDDLRHKIKLTLDQLRGRSA